MEYLDPSYMSYFQILLWETCVFWREPVVFGWYLWENGGNRWEIGGFCRDLLGGVKECRHAPQRSSEAARTDGSCLEAREFVNSKCVSNPTASVHPLVAM